MSETNNGHGGKREGAGAPLGNKNSTKSKRLFGETIKRIVHQSEGKIAEKIAWALINKASEGDIGAIKEFADRVEGKAVATNELTGADGGDVIIKVVTGIDDSDESDGED